MKRIKRFFRFGELVLPDPDAMMTKDEVLNFYKFIYDELEDMKNVGLLNIDYINGIMMYIFI